MDNLAPYRLSAEAQAKLRDMETVGKYGVAGHTLRELAGYSDKVMGDFYGAARGLFEQERLTDAVDAFTFLVTIDPFAHCNWLGLGMAEQAQGHYVEALNAYSMAVLCDFQEPAGHYYSGKCFYALNQLRPALASFDLAVVFSMGQVKYETVKQLADEAREFVRKAHIHELEGKG